MSQFGVDLKGVIDLLSRHIYSGPEVYLRELLQNSRDAIVARAAGATPEPAWGVRIQPARDGAPFVLADDGIGLAAGEIADLLATVGRSSKRDVLDLPHGDYLGHFGIGLLSCFMVADQIRILSRKDGHRAALWTGMADGTYTVEELTDSQTDALPIGTRVTLAPSRERAALLGERRVRELAAHYGEFLPLPVHVENADGSFDAMTSAPPFLPGFDREAALDHGERLLGHRPLDVFDISVRATGTTGVAYVLAKPTVGRAQRGARVYLGRMLLSPDEPAIVPEWAFFLHPVVTSDHLTPTASREQLVKDDAVASTRDGVAEAFRGWVARLAAADRPRLDAFMRAHDLAIRAACVEDPELLRILGPFLSFETASGELSLEQIAATGEPVQYAPSLDEFRMLAGMRAPGILINAAYVHHEELLREARHLYEDLNVREADVMARLAQLAEPDVADRPRTDALAASATEALAAVDVDAVVKVLPEPSVASLYVADAQVLARADLQRATEIAQGPWAATLRAAGSRVDEVRARTGDVVRRAQVCLNWANPVVQHLAEIRDQAVAARAVRLLYVQALLDGRRPLTERDRALMTHALDDLITMSVGLTAPGDAP